MKIHAHTREDATRWSVVGLLLVAGLLATASLVGCKTTEGFGKDVKDLGEGIGDSAAENS